MKTPNTPANSADSLPRAKVAPAVRPLGNHNHHFLLRLGMICAALMACAGISRAASGTWTNDGSGLWSSVTNWQSGTVADGTDSTADFSTIGTTAARTATLDTSRNLGNFVFGQASGTNQWTVNATNGSVLTLAVSAGSPTLTVTNTAVVTAPLAGTSGLTLAGPGKLVLGGSNSYSGATAITSGILQLTNIPNTNLPVLYFSFDNVSGNTVINQGTGGGGMNGTLVGASIVPGGIHGHALSIPAGVSDNAYVLVNNAVVPLNITTPATWTVAMWIQTTTAGAAYFYQGSAGWASGNTEFYLENGTGGDGAGTHAGGVRFAQGWESGTAVINDGNWHFVVMTCTNATKTIYVDGVVDAFVSGVNQWTAAGTGNQVRIGGGASTDDSQIGLNGLIDEVYMYNVALSQAQVTALMNTSAGPTALVSIPAASTVSVAAASKFDVNGGTPGIAGLTGFGTVDTTIAGGVATLAISNNANVEFDGLLTNTTGTLALLKYGSGNLTLAGTNGNTGATIVNGGTLTLGTNNIYTVPMTVYAGTLNLTGTNNSTGIHTLYNNGTLLLTGNAAINSTHVTGGTSARLVIGASTGANAAVYQSGAGSSVFIIQGGGDFQMGAVPGAFGYYNFSAGNITIGNGGEIDPGGSAGGAGTFGELDMSGTASLNVGTSGTGATYFLPNRGGVGESSVVNVGGNSTVTLFNGIGDAQFGGFEMNWAAGGQTNATTISGNAIFQALSVGVKLNFANNTANVASLNLNGGLFQVFGFSANQNASAVINFNGGTLKAGNTATGTGNNVANDNNFLANVASVFVYGNGATFDDNGQTVTFTQPLSTPTGSGVTSIPVTAAGTGYTMPPLVTITDAGGGSGATAYATVSGGAVTGIIVTSPGNNYVTPAVTLTGGGFTSAATTGTPVISANTSGGLTKNGVGSLTLSGGYTYTGPTVVNAGTLILNPLGAAPGSPGTLMVGSNASLTINASSGTPLLIGSLAAQTNANINLSYGTLSANPATPAITASGSLGLAAGPILNVSAFGLQQGQFPLIKYSGAPLANLGNLFLGPLPPGVVAHLVNDTASNSIDLVITGTGQNLSWYSLTPSGTTSSNWDIATTFDWALAGTTNLAEYKEYTTTSTVGDPVTFDDTVFSDGVDPVVSTINMTTQVRPFQFVVDANTVPYTFAGPGGYTGLGTLVKSNAGSLTLLTSNSYTGGSILAGGTVIITNNTGLGASNGPLTLAGSTLQMNGPVTNSRPISLPANSIIDVASGVTSRFGGNISGAGSLDKTDAGTLIVAGSNALTGAINITQGAITSSGTDNINGFVTVGDTSGFNSILNISGGAFNANNANSQFTSGLVSGSANGSSGDITLSGGVLTVVAQFSMGNSLGAYGAFTMTGGSLFANSFIVVGFTGDIGVYNQSAGTTIISNNLMTIAAGGLTSVGVANFSGGTYTATNSGGTGNNTTRGGLFVGEVGTGTLNVSGTASILALGQTNVTIGRDTGSAGTLDLNGGTITTFQVSRGAGSAGLNLNGGTLKASAANASFLTGLNYASVYGGGAVFDDGGFAVTVGQPLLAPSGLSVGSITVSSGGSGYIDTPVVTITGGTGSNAMAIATVNTALGTVTGFTITSPGTGYTAGDGLSVNITGGGGTGASANLPVLVAASTTGGLTKKGAGNLTLSGVNTFTGPITNSAGTLTLNSASTYSGGAVVNAGSLFTSTAAQIPGNITVSNGATFGVTQVGTGTETIGNLTLGVSATNGATLSLAYAAGNTATPLLNVGTLTLNGSNSVAIGGRFTVGVVPLVKYTGAIAGAGVFTNLAVPQGVVATLSNNAASSTLFAVITSTGPGLVWTGTNSNPALSNLWDLNSTTNWLLGAVATTYQETIPPGDSVTFNDVGTGTVILNSNASPTSVLISNNAVNYTFQGSGHIAGTTGLVKTGSGALNMNLTNNTYSGDTVISNGTVTLGANGALSANANLTLNGGTLLELAGFNDTVNALTGSGTIDNNSPATSPVLTVGNLGGGGIWAGTITNNVGAGTLGASLTKIGTNTMVVSGPNYLNSGNPSQVNAGTLSITNGGLFSMASSEFWIAATAGSTATNTIDGGTLNISNNWLVVGRGFTTANGTLIVNRGTVNKAGANNIVVGSLTGTGTIIVNGGTVLNSGMLWLGENAGANATLQLNGGLIQAAQVRVNENPGIPNLSIAYFNGGTLQATASTNDFISAPTLAVVQTGGLILDDGGNTISLTTQGLTEDPNFPGGGLIKKGSGTFYMDNSCGVTGMTIVSNGTLAGLGTFTGPITVAPGGTIGAGDAGTSMGTLNMSFQPLVLNGNAMFRISKSGGIVNDVISGYSTVNYGGTLTISNLSTDTLVVGDQFTLFSGGGTGSGNFSSIIGSPGSGLAYSFAPSSGILSIITGSTIASNPTNITAVLHGNQLTLSWPLDHLGWFLQSQTNTLNVGLIAGAAAWHDFAGSDSTTQEVITVDSTKPTVFFRLRHP